MDLAQSTLSERNIRARKMMLWFGMGSLFMGFAGWTSAYVVRSKEKDWVSSIELPPAFYISALVLLVSSVTYFLAKRAIQRNEFSQCTVWLVSTFVLALIFASLQFIGFDQMLDNGYNFTGVGSSIKMSFIYLIAVVHLAHLSAGLISLSVVLYKHVNRKYSSESYLGLDLSATFWHFLDFLWIYLVVFMTFVK